MKEIACRKLLQKLEFHSLIQLPPRQRYGSKRITAKIESFEITQSLLFCSLSEIKPVQLINVSECSKYEKAFNYLMKEHHSLSVGRNLMLIQHAIKVIAIMHQTLFVLVGQKVEVDNILIEQSIFRLKIFFYLPYSTMR